MLFNQHSRIEGKHALLSPSQHAWTNYDDVKLRNRYFSARAAQTGSDKHALAAEAIRLGIHIHPSEEALAAYVNDAIGYKMQPEQTLFYSENCFGTADAIGFARNKLRIHDLKTGISPSKERQLEVYAALFCLEYGMNPADIGMELRIYQRDEVRKFTPHPKLILDLMEQIVHSDELIEEMKAEERGF